MEIFLHYLGCKLVEHYISKASTMPDSGYRNTILEPARGIDNTRMIMEYGSFFSS